jgi:hypothetical protein
LGGSSEGVGWDCDGSVDGVIVVEVVVDVGFPESKRGRLGSVDGSCEVENVERFDFEALEERRCCNNGFRRSRGIEAPVYFAE